MKPRGVLVFSALVLAALGCQEIKIPAEIQQIIDKAKKGKPLSSAELKKLTDWQSGIASRATGGGIGAAATGSAINAKTPFAMSFRMKYTEQDGSSLRTEQTSGSFRGLCARDFSGFGDQALGITDPTQKGSSFFFATPKGMEGKVLMRGTIKDGAGQTNAAGRKGAGVLTFYTTGKGENMLLLGSLIGTFSGTHTDPEGHTEPSTDGPQFHLPSQEDRKWNPGKPSPATTLNLSAKALNHAFETGKPETVEGSEQVTIEDGTITKSWTYSFTLTINPGPADIYLDVSSLDYQGWIPAVEADSEPGAKPLIGFTAQAKTRSGRPVPADKKVEKVSYFLVDVSQEPGHSLNEAGDEDDMMFRQDDQEPDVRVESPMTAVCTSPEDKPKVFVRAMDYGARAKLLVRATLKDGEEIEGELSGVGPEILLPRRSPNSKVAQAWLDRNNGGQDEDDLDKQEHNTHDGDGLSLYEEYRGLKSHGKHLRTDPHKKDLFVLLDPGAEKAEAGFPILEDAAGISVHRLDPGETDYRVVNPYTNSAHTQMCLRITVGTLDDELAVAEARPSNPDESPIHSPKDCTEIVLSSSAHPKVIAEMPHTVAHELAHGCGVRHHGPTITPELVLRSLSVDSPAIVYDENGQEIKDRPYEIRGNISSPGSESSGDVDCLMFYHDLYQWVIHKAVVNGKNMTIYVKVPKMEHGLKLCTSAAGTGWNKAANPLPTFGPATAPFGNCMGQFNIKDP